MKKIIYSILLIFLSTQIDAKVLISPADAMKQNFTKNTKISKKTITLTAKQAKNLQKAAKAKIKNKKIKLFIAKKSTKTLGYGIIINKKVRSKNAVVLYIIDNKGILKTIEIIAFNEPLEYIPSKTWQKQFQNISTKKKLKLNKDIPTITGATLSAKSIVDGSRLAFAFYEEIIKGK